MFSWSDSIHAAFSSCLPCLSHPPESPSQDSLLDPTANHVRRARPDELQGLLADVDADTDTEAERLSLHSNPGLSTSRKRRTKNKKGKRITFFGYYLFGKPAIPPIHLPDENEDEDNLGIESNNRVRTQSSVSLDSDAAPVELDPATIARISELELAAQAFEAERQKQERRRERKERKRIAKALSLAHEGNSEFEGFQGSGGDLPPVYTYSAESQDGEYGPYVDAPQLPEDEGTADFDGGFYARKSPIGPSSGSRSGSDSRSRTSASRSQPDATVQQQPYYQQPGTASSSSPHKKTFKPNSTLTPKRKSHSTASGSSHTSYTAQSSSLASPSSSTFPKPNPAVFEGPQRLAPNPEFSGAYDEDDPSPGHPGLVKGIEGRGAFPSQGFPSSGLSAGRADMDRKRKDSVHALGGAFLAVRGDVPVGAAGKGGEEGLL